MNLRISLILLFFSFFYSICLKSEKRKIFAKKISEEIILDGQITESFWLDAESSSDFVQYSPRDSVRAELQSEFRVAYDDKFIYIVAKMEDISSKNSL